MYGRQMLEFDRRRYKHYDRFDVFGGIMQFDLILGVVVLLLIVALTTSSPHDESSDADGLRASARNSETIE